jgi:acyl carrier protein
VAPEGPVQETLASIWRAVLGLQSIGIDDDFFELGGHSMLVVKMLGRLQDALGIEFFVGDVFEHSTIRELADSVTAQMLGDASDEELAGLLAEAEAEQ